MLQNPQWEHWQDKIKEAKEEFKAFKESTKKKSSLKPKQ